MKIGIVAPTLQMFVEKYAALFHPDPIVVFSCPQYKDSNDCTSGYIEKFWKPLGLNIELRIAPYHKWDFSDIDILIESIECFQYGNGWREWCTRIRHPKTVFKVCFINDVNFLPKAYRRKIGNCPFIVEAQNQVHYWKSVGFKPTLIHNPVGHWWFENEWTGVNEKVIYVIAGIYKWRPDLVSVGWDWWQNIEKRIPGHYLHHDAAELEANTPLEHAKFFSESRVFANLDWESQRPLSTAFIEALAAGIPVVARDCPSLNYRDFIDGNGIASNDFEEIVEFIQHCLNDIDFAKKCGNRSREIAKEHFSSSILKQKFLQTIGY